MPRKAHRGALMLRRYDVAEMLGISRDNATKLMDWNYIKSRMYGEERITIAREVERFLERFWNGDYDKTADVQAMFADPSGTRSVRPAKRILKKQSQTLSEVGEMQKAHPVSASRRKTLSNEQKAAQKEVDRRAVEFAVKSLKETFHLR